MYLMRTIPALPPFTPGDILAQPISTNLLPLDLLPSNGQLPPEPLERALRSTDERPVQLLLVIPLGGRDARDDRLGGDGGHGQVNRLGRVERHVPVFVVVHVDVDLAGQGGG